MSGKVPLLVISGSMGAGKSTVLSEASDLLAGPGKAHAAIDLDWLAVMHPQQGEYGSRLMFANLAAVWPIYAAAGAERLLVAPVVENRSELRFYQQAIPSAEPVLCYLTASIETMQERLRIREPGMFQEEAVARAAELAIELADGGAEDFTIDERCRTCKQNVTIPESPAKRRA